MLKKKKQGRPPIPKKDRVVYKRPAVYPKTHERIQNNAKAKNIRIIDYIEELVP